MSFMKKNLNLGLLFIIMLLAVSLTAIGVYYNLNYNSLSAEYTTQLTNLQDVTDELFLQKSRLNQTAADLRVKEQDETELSSKFSDIRGENIKLTGENANLKTELTSRTNELVTKTNQLLVAQSELITVKSELENQESLITAYRSTVNRLKNDIEEICGGDMSECS
ncbi:hypothetical protein GOV09_03195 [Candidatus Woesearchaeota archaeon]|nr:hypothetical protein [Candidatus Woesearchaeota archaeon]